MFPLGLEELAVPKDLQYMIDVFVLDQDNAAAAKVRRTADCTHCARTRRKRNENKRCCAAAEKPVAPLWCRMGPA